MTWPTLIRYYFYLKFDRKSRDWIYEYWRQTHTKRKTNPLPFRNYQKHQYWWISLFTVDVQTSIPSKHKYRGQRRKNRIYLVPWTPKLPLPRGQTPGLYLSMLRAIRKSGSAIPPLGGGRVSYGELVAYMDPVLCSKNHWLCTHPLHPCLGSVLFCVFFVVTYQRT